ncbi:unnamed protein product [Ostreobium quekettii]|uniref:Uncharacterized protein n=1 Tax=Ostreobium quekettii TaxID=121088 RepID=A0A8S1J476_9CHLO|nr:unnamed protein product [Ostreobium quekettii]
MLTAEELRQIVFETKVQGMLMGGSALFRANGQTQFGARKLISLVHGADNEEGGLQNLDGVATIDLPIAMWRLPGDDPIQLLKDFIAHCDGH